MRASRRFLNRPIQVQTKTAEINEPFFAAADSSKANSGVPKAAETAEKGIPQADTSATIVQKGILSTVSWGETSGIYPTKDNKYDPSKWDATKLAELLKARSAIHEVAKRGQKVHTASPNDKDPIESKLKPYHLIENFPTVDTEIADADVKWFYLSHLAELKTHPTMPTLIWVKSYGAFYNNGGGDVKKGDVYIHFYKK